MSDESRKDPSDPSSDDTVPEEKIPDYQVPDGKDPDPKDPKDSRPRKMGEDEPDAETPELLAYCFGSVTNDLSGAFYNLLNPFIVLVLALNPLLVGVVMALKTIWDGVSDPIMAYISDNIRWRFGRRRPFVLIGGIAMPIIFALTWFLFPVFFNVDEVIQMNEPPATVEEIQEEVAAEELAAQELATEEQKPEVLPTEEADLGSEMEKLVGKKTERKSIWENLAAGFEELKQSDDTTVNIIIFLSIALIFLATAQTLYSVPYYALGIEICPSYDGRTRVNVYRSALQKITAIFKQMLQPLMFGSIALTLFGIGPYFLFESPIAALQVISIIMLVVSIPATLIMFFKTKERAPIRLERKDDAGDVIKNMGFFRAIVETAKNFNVVRVFFLMKVIGISNGIFMYLAMYVNIFYVFNGDKGAGAAQAAQLAIVTMIISFLLIPVTRWMCKRFEKHRTLAFSMVMLGTGAGLQWVLYIPGKPFFQFILTPFLAFGFTAFYIVINAMIADITDDDELRTGERREAMIGAVMSFFNKAMDVFQNFLAGAVLVMAGLHAASGGDQADGVIWNLRFMSSIIPCVIIFSGIILLWKYPLTERRIEEVKSELADRRAKGQTKG